LHQQPADPRIAVLADALLAFCAAAAEWCAGQANKSLPLRRRGLAIALRSRNVR
jgi:hypothetical protein